MRRGVMVAVGVAAILAAAAGVAVAAYDGSRRDLIAPGVRVGGVAVGGLHAAQAQERLRRALRARTARPVVVRAGGHRFRLTARRALVRVDVPALVDRAVAQSRHGSVLTRTVHGLTGARVDRDVPVRATYSQAAVDRLVRRVGATVDRPAVNASLHPAADGLSIRHSRPGVHLAAAPLRRAIGASLARPGARRRFAPRLAPVAPQVTTRRLARRYPAYIIIDRAGFTLRFYRRLKLSRTYPIAVGRQGLETPAGLYDIQWKQTNPSWYVPNSPWAGDLAGKVIPPGPDDPIKARWMAFNGGAGIHGIDPSEYGSIGHNASHGCVRMRIPDVIELYAHAPVHTPVFVA